MSIESEIHWGTNYENVLSFAHPTLLDDRRTWRKPVPGSRRIRNDAGTTDSWVSARDFMLAVRARHFDPSRWPDLQDFLGYAGDGNVFRFVPDRRYPSFYVADCLLDEPFDDPQPSWEQSDVGQSIDFVIRNQAFDFNLALRGLMFEYTPEKSITDPSSMLASMDRGTPDVYQLSRAGIFEPVTTNILRDRNYAWNPVTGLLERATYVGRGCTNSALNSSNFVNGGSWAIGGAGFSAITAAASKISGQTAYLHTATAGGSSHRLQTLGTFNGSVDCAWMIVEPGTATQAEVSLFDSTGAAHVALGRLVFATEVFTITSGSGYGGFRKLGPNTWLIWVAGVGTNGNARRIICYPCGSPSTTTTAIMHHGQLEPGRGYPSAVIVTAGSTVTSDDDLLDFPWPFVPQECTFYIRAFETGMCSSLLDGQAFLALTNAAGAVPRWMLWFDGDAGGSDNRIRSYHETSAGTIANATGALANPTSAQQVEIRATLAASGVNTHLSINGAAELSGNASSALALAAAWPSTPRLLIGRGFAGGTSSAVAQFAHIKVAAGIRTMAEMRAA